LWAWTYQHSRRLLTHDKVRDEPAREPGEPILGQDGVEHVLPIQTVRIVALERAPELMPGFGRQIALPSGRLATAEHPRRVELA